MRFNLQFYTLTGCLVGCLFACAPVGKDPRRVIGSVGSSPATVPMATQTTGLIPDLQPKGPSYYTATLHKRRKPSPEGVIAGQVWLVQDGNQMISTYNHIFFVRRTASLDPRQKYKVEFLQKYLTDTVARNGTFNLRVKPGDHTVDFVRLNYKLLETFLRISPQDSLHLDIFLVPEDPLVD